MKKFIGLVCLFAVSVICLINLGEIVAYDWTEIEDEAVKGINYIMEKVDLKLDEAGDFIDEKLVSVFDKD